MFKHPIYRTANSETKIMSIYNKHLSNLNLDYENKMVNTSFGYTRILVIGPKNAEPLMFFHAANCTNPFCLQWFLPLAKQYRLYAPDVVGQPGGSSQIQLSNKDDSYGRWAADVISALKINNCHCLGVSFGGGILLKLAAFAPELITSASLVVPSSVTKTPSILSYKIAMHSLLYILYSSKENLCKILSPLCSQIDDNMLDMAEAFYKNTKLKMNSPKNIFKKHLQNFKAPVLVIAAEKDILFPGKAVLKNAKKIIPNLVNAELLEGSPHMFAKPAERLEYVNNCILKFLHENRTT